jgi:hypothetical protein
MKQPGFIQEQHIAHAYWAMLTARVLWIYRLHCVIPKSVTLPDHTIAIHLIPMDRDIVMCNN